MTDSWALVPGLFLPMAVARQLDAVCALEGCTRDRLVRMAIETFVSGYLAGHGLATGTD